MVNAFIVVVVLTKMNSKKNMNVNKEKSEKSAYKKAEVLG